MIVRLLYTFIITTLMMKARLVSDYFLFNLIQDLHQRWSLMDLTYYLRLYSRMFIQLSFFLYLFVLTIFAIYTGLNYYRIQAKGWIHPQVITFLFPIIINFFIAKFVFSKINPLFTTLLPCILIYFIGQKLKKVRIFGLTGGIACGKSTLVQLMQENIGSQLAIIDCDKINTSLREKGRAGYKLILKLLKQEGEDPVRYVSDYSQEIKRQVLSNYCFQHQGFLKKLASRLGKYIFFDIFKQIFHNIISNKKLILIDAPTLFETKVLTYICFPIIVVGCTQQIQLERLMKNRKFSEEEAKNRINSQMPLPVKQKLADIYIDNKGTPEQMFHNTLKSLNKILKVGNK